MKCKMFFDFLETQCPETIPSIRTAAVKFLEELRRFPVQSELEGVLDTFVQRFDTPEVTMYTDGSCLGNPGPGGWAVLIAEKGHKNTIYSGGLPSTTNNRAELTAIIEGLKRVDGNRVIRIRTDSSYVITVLTPGGNPRKNLDLIREAKTLMRGHKVVFEKVKAHKDGTHNIVDQLAREEATRIR